VVARSGDTAARCRPVSNGKVDHEITLTGADTN
jgi:hypothetical protein